MRFHLLLLSLLLLPQRGQFTADLGDPRLIGWHGETFQPSKVFAQGRAAPRMEVVSWKPRVFMWVARLHG